jgi:hypothetical protein
LKPSKKVVEPKNELINQSINQGNYRVLIIYNYSKVQFVASVAIWTEK